MNKVSLSRKPDEFMPTTVNVNGVTYAIRWGHRSILNIFNLLSDPEIEDRHKKMKAVQLFYPESIPPIEDAFEAFTEFVKTPEKRTDISAACIDFEFDADVIYASFLQQYGIDLFSTTLHWYAFTALLGGLGENTALAQRLALRELDTSKFKGKAKTRATIAKANAQPPRKTSQREEERQAKILDALMNGGDVSAIIDQE